MRRCVRPEGMIRVRVVPGKNTSTAVSWLIIQYRKQKLVDLGADALADALLEIAGRNEAADDFVERLIASSKDNIRRFKTKLSRLQISKRFIPWNEAAGFADELQAILEDLKAGVTDAGTGVGLLAAFYQNDRLVFDHCDDSNGHVGDVFRHGARDLFVAYASRCQDKDWMGELVLELNQEDGYGIRRVLIDCAVEYLPEPVIRTMISRLEDLAEKAGDGYERRHWLYLIESLAAQIKDAPLFEKTRITGGDGLSVDSCVDIARVYLQSGDEKTALLWLDRVPLNDTFHAHERDDLLLDIYARLGDRPKQAEVAWRIFRRHRCNASLDELLAVIGHDQRDSVIADEVTIINEEEALSLSDARFLIELEHLDEAETYLLDRTNQMNGDYYGSLLPLAEAMETADRHLAATAVYRALLDSILQKAYSRAYWHGARYLKKLDSLANSVSDWGNLEGHAAYSEDLRQRHGRKRSFWARYEGNV